MGANPCPKLKKTPIAMISTEEDKLLEKFRCESKYRLKMNLVLEENIWGAAKDCEAKKNTPK